MIYICLIESSTGITSALSTSSINSGNVLYFQCTFNLVFLLESYRTTVTTTSFSSDPESSTESLIGTVLF